MTSDIHKNVIVVSSSPVKEDPNSWIPNLDLTFSDKMILQSSTAWLNDGLINAAQTLLKNQSNGRICGWSSTSKRTGVDKFPVIPSNSPFIQILNVSSSHWVAISNMDVGRNTHHNDAVGVYDSLFLKVTLATKQDVCSFLRPLRKTLIFDIKNIKAQPNSHDCGLYAIACATELVYGFDPVVCHFDCSAMRPHLLNSFTKGYIDRFPSKERRVPFGNRVRRSLKESIFCICRMPNDPKRAMIQCGRCRQEWFYKECANLSINDMEHTKSTKWICQKCTQFLYSLHKDVRIS